MKIKQLNVTYLKKWNIQIENLCEYYILDDWSTKECGNAIKTEFGILKIKFESFWNEKLRYEKATVIYEFQVAVSQKVEGSFYKDKFNDTKAFTYQQKEKKIFTIN